MTTGWRYRLASVTGTALLAAIAIAVVNEPAVQNAFATVPYFGRPAPVVLENSDLLLAITTAVVVTVAAMWQLFKPRPRRILDAVLETQRRVLLAMVALAALGYFNYTYRLPRPTLMLATVVLLVALPAYMVVIRRRPASRNRALLVGDDAHAMRETIAASDDHRILGFVAPAIITREELIDFDPAQVDSSALERLGGLSRIEEVILSNDVDTVLLAFGSTDRAEFFGTLTTCHANGVDAKLHRDHADNVLISRSPETELVDVELEPWDFQERLVKRLFDVSFAGLALLALSPVIILITIAIKLDDGGPILYSQERTAEFGNRFTVYKFRTMRPGGENVSPGEEVDRITRTGRFLRRSHLDEIPQLWSILTGQMSVVGPRAVWVDEETQLEAKTSTWRKRWFVKPGLTGLAQIRGADSTAPDAKLRYDLEYIRDQSFWLDLKIVIRQLWQVGSDLRASIATATDTPAGRANEASKSRIDAGKTATVDHPLVTDGNPGETTDEGGRETAQEEGARRDG